MRRKRPDDASRAFCKALSVQNDTVFLIAQLNFHPIHGCERQPKIIAKPSIWPQAKTALLFCPAPPAGRYETEI